MEKWTKEQEDIVLQCIKESKTNTEGFKKASIIINKSFANIQSKYTKKLLTDENRKKHKWIKKEIDILLNNIKKYPTNIKHALQLTGNQLGLEFGIVWNKWYGSPSCKHLALRNNPKIYQLTCGSKLGFSQNVKNNKRKKDEEGNLLPPEQTLNSFEVMVNQMLQLSLKDRKKVINYFINNDNSIKISNSNININNNNNKRK